MLGYCRNYRCKRRGWLPRAAAAARLGSEPCGRGFGRVAPRAARVHGARAPRRTKN